MSFKDIKGQDKSIQILKEYIAHLRLGGSFLFAGEEGVGKNLVAKTLAKALNCLNADFSCDKPELIDSCDHCVSCLKIESNQHPDVHMFDSGITEPIKIEEIRNLQRDINLKSYEARYRVFIFNDAHNLTAEAGNAFLKILEEPPKGSLIILISAKPNLLFKTIISRCRVLKFQPLKRQALEGILKTNYCLDNNLAHFLAYFSEGRIGRALKLKDTGIFQEKNRIIDEFTFLSKQLQNSPAQTRDVVRGYFNILAGWFRDIYLIKIGMPYSELINLDRKTELLRFMNHYTFSELNEIIKSISDSLLFVEQNINIKLLLSNLKLSLKKSL
jgi:DNA polymerase-3 subunit delta'